VVQELANYHTDTINAITTVEDFVWTGGLDQRINIFHLPDPAASSSKTDAGAEALTLRLSSMGLAAALAAVPQQ